MKVSLFNIVDINTTCILKYEFESAIIYPSG